MSNEIKPVWAYRGADGELFDNEYDAQMSIEIKMIIEKLAPVDGITKISERMQAFIVYIYRRGYRIVEQNNEA